MKVREAVKLITGHEVTTFRAGIHAGRWGAVPSLLPVFDAVCDLNQVNDTWSESDLVQKLTMPGSPAPSPGYVRKQSSLLGSCIERYITQQQFERDAFLQSLCKLRALHARGWTRAYNKEYRHLIADLQARPLQAFETLAARLQVEEEHMLSPVVEGFDQQQPLYQSAIDALDQAFALKQLSLACKAANQDIATGTQHHHPLLEAAITYAEGFHDGDRPMLRFYLMVYRLVSTGQQPDLTHFKEVREHLFLHYELLQTQPSELQDVLTYFINCCTRGINHGIDDFKTELASLYDRLLKDGVLERNGHLSVATFRNAYLMFSLSGDVNASKRLLKDYSDRLKGESARAIVPFLEGYEDYVAGRHRTAAAAFTQVLAMLLRGLPDDRLEAETLTMLVRIACDGGAFVDAQGHLRSLKSLLHRKRPGTNPLSKEDVSKFSRFWTYTSGLIKAQRLTPPLRSTESERLIAAIEAETRTVMAKKWLLQSLRTLSSKKR